MTTYLRNQPVAGDDLSVSQPNLTNNTNAADTIYGYDHFAFSNTTGVQGLHNTVTTPTYQNPVGTNSTTPPTTSASPIFYAINPNTSGNVPVIQFSRGISNAVPTPLTKLQSPSSAITIAPRANSAVLDCSGLTNFFGVVYLYGDLFAVALASYKSATLIINNIVGNGLYITAAGSVIQITNATVGSVNIFWSLEILRVS